MSFNLDKLNDLGAGEIIVISFTFLALTITLSIVFTIPVWLCWNWIASGILGLPELTLVQSWGLSMLCGFLFKNINLGSSKTRD